MDRLAKAVEVLYSSKRLAEMSPPSASRKTENCDKERAAFFEIRDALIRGCNVRKDPRFNDLFTRSMELMFSFLDHRNTDMRLIAEQTLDAVFRHFINELSSSRILMVLMTEIKRNGAARTLAFALSRLADVVCFVKANRAGSVGLHLLAALNTIARRPEDAVQSAIEKNLPLIFAVIGQQLALQRGRAHKDVLESALFNLELPGTMSRAAAVMISQLASYFPSILNLAFKQFSKTLSAADDQNARNLLVGTLNSLRLMWPTLFAHRNDFELEALQMTVCNVMRCLYSSHNDVVVASLELLERIVKSADGPFHSTSFFPQMPTTYNFPTISDEPKSLHSSLSHLAGSQLSSLHTSPTSFVCGGSVLNVSSEQPLLVDSPSVAENVPLDIPHDLEDTISDPPSKSSSLDEEEVLDPLRHHELLDEVEPELEPIFSPVSSEPLIYQSEPSSIPVRLPVENSCQSFAIYASVLLARRFLLSDQSLMLIPDRDVRVSHKILALNCISHLALHISNFADISLRQPGRLGEPTLKDLRLFLSHEDDHLKSVAVTVIVNAARSAFRSVGEQFNRSCTFFKRCVEDVMRIRRAQCTRALLSALRGANQLVYFLKMTDEIYEFACENARDNYFLLRIAVAEYLSSIQWENAESTCNSLPREVIQTYLGLLADDDPRVRKAAAENLVPLVRNANFCEFPNALAVEIPSLLVCPAFRPVPLTVAMGSEYNLLDERADFAVAQNLAVVRDRLIAALTRSASESEQAGLVLGLVNLAAAFPPCEYPCAWGIDSYTGETRVDVLASLTAKCACACPSITIFANLLQIIGYLFAGLSAVRVSRVLPPVCEEPTVPEVIDPHILDQLILLPLRVLNLYYSLVMERQQSSQSSSMLVHPALSPVRKALPVSSTTGQSIDARLCALSTLTGTNVRPTRLSSFFYFSTLANMADALRGTYTNYLAGVGEEVKERFAALLVAALNNFSSLLEMVTFRQISGIIEEVLLYCRVAVDIAPAETITMVTNLFKVVFGDNGANVSINALRNMHIGKHRPSQNLLDAYLLRSANMFTQFVVASGRIEVLNSHLLRCTGWLRKDTVYKQNAPPSAIISPYISLFESFVSLSIRLYQSSNSCSLQSATLNLLCELIRGGINFSMLDPDMRFVNFVIAQINEFGTRSFCSTETVGCAEETLLRSIFELFVVLSHTESRGQFIVDPNNMFAYAEVVVNAAQTRPQLAAHALRCTEIPLLDFVGVRMRYSGTLLNTLSFVNRLAEFCPTEVLQLWALVLHGARIFDSDQNWTKASLTFFEKLQGMNSNWTLDTAVSAVIALRSCSSCIFRPVDAFFNKMISLLDNEGVDVFDRLLYAFPYIFYFLCIMQENVVMPRIEEIYESPSERIAKLLMGVLFEGLTQLRRMNVAECLVKGSEAEKILSYYLLVLSHSLRCRGAISITNFFTKLFPDDLTELYDLSMLHAPLFAQLLAFFNALKMHNHSIFSRSYGRRVFELCILLRCQTNHIYNAVLMLDHCTPSQFRQILAAMNRVKLFRIFPANDRETLLQKCISCAHAFHSSYLIDIVSVIDVNNLRFFSSLSFLLREVGKSEAVDRRILPLLQRFFGGQFHLQEDERLDLIRIGNERKQLFFRLKILEQLGRLCSYFFVVEADWPNIFHYTFENSDPVDFGTAELRDALLHSVWSSGDSIEPDSYGKLITSFDPESGERIMRSAYSAGKFDIISACIEELQRVSVIGIQDSMLYSSVPPERVQQLSQVCVDLAFDPSLGSPLQLSAQGKISQKAGLMRDAAAKFAMDKNRFKHWMVRYADYLFVTPSPCLDLDKNTLDAISFGLSQPSFIAAVEEAQNSREVIEQQLALAVNLARIVRLLQMRPANRSNFQEVDMLHRSNWEVIIHDRTGWRDFDIGFFTEAIQTAFDVVLQYQGYFRKEFERTKLLSSLESVAIAIARLPFINDISCIPRLALLCNWKVELEVHRTSISVPTVNIHYLSNVDVLREFTWRLSWAGWNRRANFDNFSMSLFGVLSSTPTGSELNSATLSVAEQIMASTAAVDGLTCLLVEGFLYPERGNPVASRFIARHREATSDFLSSTFGQRACMLGALLLGLHPETVGNRNLELVENDGTEYRAGQLSVHAIWSMTGLLDQERSLYQLDLQPQSSPRRTTIPSSESRFLFDSGHDPTNESCLRMLFDTYSHWFRSGIDDLPLPLLSATISSATLLSDLFTELAQYKFVFEHMKNFYDRRSQIENVDLGNVIYLLLKCTAVLGGDTFTKGDGQKTLFGWVECGLTSTLSEIRVRTIQGILYLVQAFNPDDLKVVLPYLHSHIGSALRLRSANVDPVNNIIELEADEYDTMLWTLGFFFCENPLYSTETFNLMFTEFVCIVFMSLLTPNRLMNLLTCGMERLIVSSRMYILRFSRVSAQVIGEYYFSPKKFVYGLRVLISCLYRGLHEDSIVRVGAETYDPRLHFMEQQPMLFRILAKGDEEHAALLLSVLPFMLMDTLNQSEIINSVLRELVHGYPQIEHPRYRFIFTIIHFWFSVLHSRETEAVVRDWTLNGLDSFKYVTHPDVFRSYVSAFLSSSNPNPNIWNLFYLATGRNTRDTWLDRPLFCFTVGCLFSRLNDDDRDKLRDSLRTVIRNGRQHVDERRLEDLPFL